MSILVVGRGWTGRKMVEELYNRGHVVTHCSHTTVTKILNENRFSWVVNCAGVTGIPNVDACEYNKSDTLKGNAIFPILLYEECKRLNIRFSHFSSGCIYSGTITDTTTDPNFFGSIYSVSKGISDMYLKDKAQVFRIRMPFTGVDEPKNYLSKVLKYAKTGKLIDSGQNSLTDLDEAVRVACDLIDSGAPDGAYNLVNSDSINMHELMEMLGISPEWYTPEEFKAVTIADRSTCVIPSYEAMRPVREALKEAIHKMGLQ